MAHINSQNEQQQKQRQQQSQCDKLQRMAVLKWPPKNRNKHVSLGGITFRMNQPLNALNCSFADYLLSSVRRYVYDVLIADSGDKEEEEDK